MEIKCGCNDIQRRTNETPIVSHSTRKLNFMTIEAEARSGILALKYFAAIRGDMCISLQI